MTQALVFAALIVAFITAMYWTPDLIPPRYFSPRTVPPGFAAAKPAQKILRACRRTVVLIGVATIGLVFLFPSFMLRGGVALCTLTFLAAFARARQAAAPYAAPVVPRSVREASLEIRSETSIVRTLVTFVPALLLAASAL
jgi:hypothetical protein